MTVVNFGQRDFFFLFFSFFNCVDEPISTHGLASHGLLCGISPNEFKASEL